MNQHAIRLFVATAGIALFTASSGVAFEGDTEDRGIQLGLYPRDLTYDPNESKNGRKFTLEVVNRSTRDINLPANYDGVVIRLWAKSPEIDFPMLLFAPRDQKTDKIIRLTPGKLHTYFSLELSEILPNDEADAKEGEWMWDWMARPKSPGTPVRRSGGDGLASVIVFWAEVVVDNQILRTAPLIVPVKSK